MCGCSFSCVVKAEYVESDQATNANASDSMSRLETLPVAAK